MLILVLVVVGGAIYLGLPFARATALLIRVSNMTGTAGSFAEAFSFPVTKAAPHTVPTRQGDVPAQFYRPAKNARGRTLLLIPGIHSMGINEPRLAALAQDLAAGGYLVMTLALPDLMAYSITTKSPDVIEDACTMHESGHLLGLVDLVLNTGRQDPEHPGHSRNRQSVMYYAVESGLVAQLLGGPPPTEFDDADRADLATIRAS